jgi:uroporphyrinogen-III synthase
VRLPTVLNTRPRAQAAELSSLIAAAGFLPIEAPAIDVVLAWDPSELSRVRENLVRHAYDWIVLSSTNSGRGLDLHDARVLCGSATASALGLEPWIALDRFSASAAVAALGSAVSPRQRVLAPRAAEGRPDLVDGLNALGLDVDAPIAYRTVAVPDAAERLRRGEIDVVALCSPSAVASVAGAVGRARVVCLGETTADAARELGMNVDAVARSTSMHSLVEAMRAVSGGLVV